MNNYLAFSIGGNGTTNYTITLPGGVNKLLSNTDIASAFFQTFFNILIFAGILIALGFALFEGYRYMTSQGDKKEIETARDSIINSLVGLVIIFTAFLVVNLIGYFFKIHLLQTAFTP